MPALKKKYTLTLVDRDDRIYSQLKYQKNNAIYSKIRVTQRK